MDIGEGTFSIIEVDAKRPISLNRVDVFCRVKRFRIHIILVTYLLSSISNIDRFNVAAGHRTQSIIQRLLIYYLKSYLFVHMTMTIKCFKYLVQITHVLSKNNENLESEITTR